MDIPLSPPPSHSLTHSPTHSQQQQKEAKAQQQAVRTQLQAKRQVAARARRYFTEYELRLKAKLQRSRTREEQVRHILTDYISSSCFTLRSADFVKHKKLRTILRLGTQKSYNSCPLTSCGSMSSYFQCRPLVLHQIFRKVLEEGLDIVRERERELGRFAREKKDRRREQQRQRLEALEQVSLSLHTAASL